MVAVPFAPKAKFSGVSGCKNPGVMVMAAVAVVDGLEVSVAEMVALTLSAVREEGGVYWPLELIVPAPVLGLTDQLTLAEPPLVRVAVNCSTAVPDELEVLQ